MSREISADFKILTSFIDKFELSIILKEQDLLDNMKPMHKKLFALMTFISEIDQKNDEHKIFSQKGLDYLKESISDMGQSFFCWSQGAYKPSNLILRSSIETFVKAIAGQEDISIYSEKNMYKVFELAKNTNYFSSGYCQPFFAKIYSSYKDLCQVVHTAGLTNMSHISALKTFPLFSKREALSFSKEFIELATQMLCVIYVNFFGFIHIMHHKNQSNFILSIPKGTRLFPRLHSEKVAPSRQ